MRYHAHVVSLTSVISRLADRRVYLDDDHMGSTLQYVHGFYTQNIGANLEKHCIPVAYGCEKRIACKWNNMTCSPVCAACGLECAACSSQFAACSSKFAACSSQFAVCSSYIHSEVQGSANCRRDNGEPPPALDVGYPCQREELPGNFASSPYVGIKKRGCFIFLLFINLYVFNNSFLYV